LSRPKEFEDFSEDIEIQRDRAVPKAFTSVEITQDLKVMTLVLQGIPDPCLCQSSEPCVFGPGSQQQFRRDKPSWFAISNTLGCHLLHETLVLALLVGEDLQILV
jgi:hypothetical protein